MVVDDLAPSMGYGAVSEEAFNSSLYLEMA